MLVQGWAVKDVRQFKGVSSKFVRVERGVGDDLYSCRPDCCAGGELSKRWWAALLAVGGEKEDIHTIRPSLFEC